MGLNRIFHALKPAGMLLLIWCCLNLTACPAQWERHVEKNGLFFEKLRFNENLGSYTGYIPEDVRAGEFLCQKGWIRFYADWTLKSCVIARDLRLSGNFIPKGAWMELDKNGRLRLAAFPHDMEIGGIVCKGTGGSPMGFHVRFHPDGALASCAPAKDVRVGGIPCRGGFFHRVVFHENGGLKECDLSEAVIHQGVSYKKGDTIRLPVPAVLPGKEKGHP